MLPKKKYRFNSKTLAYELHRTPLKVYFSRGFFLFLLTVAATVGYYEVYTRYLGLDTPKSLALKRENTALMTKLDMMNRQITEADGRLDRLKMRDNQVYRPIFGMEGIPDDVRNAGFGGVDRYSHLEYSRNARFLTSVSSRFDQVYKKTGVQSESFDHVERLAAQTGQMATSIPYIAPVNSASHKFRLSSGFGMRKDPINGAYKHHYGIDISGPQGSPIYATGDGTVVKVQYDYHGYGQYVIVDHGFGYKTRYAHLTTNVPVREGQKVNRGETIGFLGNTGRSVGAHLHYEVIYRGSPVSPRKYFDDDIALDEYEAMISGAKGQ